jgi:hypothetical protein
MIIVNIVMFIIELFWNLLFVHQFPDIFFIAFSVVLNSIAILYIQRNQIPLLAIINAIVIIAYVLISFQYSQQMLFYDFPDDLIVLISRTFGIAIISIVNVMGTWLLRMRETVKKI